MPKYVKATDASARTLALYNVVEAETKNDTVPSAEPGTVPVVPSAEPGTEHAVSSAEPGGA